MAEDDISQSPAPVEPASSTSTSESSTPAAPETSAPVSTGDSGQQAKDTLLDAVLKVVPATNEQDVLAESEAAASPEAPQPEDGKEAEAKSEDDDDAEPPAEAGHKELRRKIRKLLTSRGEYKAKVQELEAQITQARPQAEIGTHLENFCKQHDLSGDDVAYGLNAMAALRRGDWKAFYEATAGPMRHAQEYMGYAIPKDLRDQVQRGQMTEAAAKEFARMRMDQQRTEQVRMFEQQTYATQIHQQTQAQVESSVNAYEQRLAASDPDYRRKAPFVKLKVQAKLLERGGNIQSIEEALQVTKEAYDEANALLRKIQPAPLATGRQPNGNGSTRSARAEPNSLMEAAILGLERSRNGAAP